MRQGKRDGRYDARNVRELAVRCMPVPDLRWVAFPDYVCRIECEAQVNYRS